MSISEMSPSKVGISGSDSDGWRVHIIGGPYWPAGNEPLLVSGNHATREDAEAHIKHMGWEIAE
jgi:hypothetical protein